MTQEQENKLRDLIKEGSVEEFESIADPSGVIDIENMNEAILFWGAMQNVIKRNQGITPNVLINPKEQFKKELSLIKGYLNDPQKN